MRGVPVLPMLRPAGLRLPRLLHTGMPMPASRVGAVAARAGAAGNAAVMTTFPMPAVLHREPISYRQMQHWITRFPDRFSASANPGRSGVRRELTVSDVAVLLRMARLVEAGFRPDAAARLPDSDGGYYRLTPHVVVRVSVGAR